MQQNLFYFLIHYNVSAILRGNLYLSYQPLYIWCVVRMCRVTSHFSGPLYSYYTFRLVFLQGLKDKHNICHWQYEEWCLWIT
jgi:hypothetical protein